MLPILLNWGPLVLPAWHTFYVLGAFAAFSMLLYLGHFYAPDISQQDLSRLFTLSYVAGYLGARLLSILIEEPQVHGANATLAALLRFGPMTFYGGAIAVFIFGGSYVLSRRLPFAAMMDLAIPAGLLALALGRIGCFLNGDDYGKAVPLASGGSPPFWAVTFPNLDDSIARYPVQLFESAMVGFLVLSLCLGFSSIRRFGRPGLVGYLGIVGYANLRFGLEFLRDDFRGFAFGTWLSTSQFISLIVLAVCGLSIPLWLQLTPISQRHQQSEAL